MGDIPLTCTSLLPLVFFATTVKGELTCSHVDAYDRNQVIIEKGQCYHLAQDNVSWNESVKICHSNNGALASIPDSTVNAALIKRARDLDYNNLANVSFYWIGGRVDTTETGVTWLEDPGTGFVAFHAGQHAENGCLLLDPEIGGWATDLCMAELELFGYICEYPSQVLHSGGDSALHPDTQSGFTCLSKAGIIFLCVITSIITRRLGEEF